MVLLYVCCFWFSLRLGSLLIAIFFCMKAVVLLVAISSVDFEEARSQTEKFLTLIQYDKLLTRFIVEEFRMGLMIVHVYLAVYILTCFLLAFGAILCKPKLCYPFLCIHASSLIPNIMLFSVLFKYLMYLASIPPEESILYNISLIAVIVYLTVALLYIYYEIYLELCVHSFVTAVNELRKEVISKSLVPALPVVIKVQEFYEPIYKETATKLV